MSLASKVTSIAQFHYTDSSAAWRLSTVLMEQIPFGNGPLLFCCIGTDRSTGDALGPLTGSLLAALPSFPFEIFGTLEKPLHALNLKERMDKIHELYTDPYIVAIDACLGHIDNIGKIIIQNGPLLPGKAVKKELPPVGDLAIKGVVNASGYMEYSVLQNTRLHLTYEMSRLLVRALSLAWHRHQIDVVENRNDGRNNSNSGNKVSHPDFSQANHIQTNRHDHDSAGAGHFLYKEI